MSQSPAREWPIADTNPCLLTDYKKEKVLQVLRGTEEVGDRGAGGEPVIECGCDLEAKGREVWSWGVGRHPQSAATRLMGLPSSSQPAPELQVPGVAARRPRLPSPDRRSGRGICTEQSVLSKYI